MMTTQTNQLFNRSLNDELGNRTDTITLHPWNVSEYVTSTGLAEAEFEACTGKDLEIQKYLVTVSEECPCGHPTTFSEIDMSRGMVMASSDNIYSDDIVTLVPTENGYEDSDPCFCENQKEDCDNCMYLQILRMAPGKWNMTYGLRHNHQAQLTYYLTEERGFTCEGYTLEADTSDSEGFGDTADYTLYCIQYSGKYKQRRQWHVLLDDESCGFCKYRVTTGLIVPEVPRHWTNELGRRQNLLVPKVLGQYVDFIEAKSPLRLDWLSMSKLVSGKCSLPNFYVNLTTLRTFQVAGGKFLPYLYNGSAANNDLKLPIQVTAQGDEDTPAGELSIEQDTHENTTLAESTDASTAYVATEEFSMMPWITDGPHTYPDLTERWTKAFQFQWTTSQAQGEIIQRFDLPIEAIQNFINSPNALPWRQHAFYKSDIELKVQVNSQPGQSGYLILGAMYEASEGTAIGNRVDHAANIVAMPHMRISAGSSNSGDMVIPFIRHFPVGCILNNAFDVPQYFVTLFVAPLLQLRTGADGPQVVDVTIMIRFPNCEFYGQRTTEQIVTAQGWAPDLTQDGDVESNPGPFLSGLLGTVAAVGKTVAGAGSSIGSIATGVSGVANGIGSIGSAAGKVIGGVESLLRPLFPKKDMDRPQNIIEPTNFYLQQNTSLSLATGTNNVKLLQLQAENSVSHPPGFVPVDDQFNNRFILSVFGLSDYFQWFSGSASGTLLYSFDVTPLKSFTRGIPLQPEFYLTPMAALSGQYGGYHGDMEMRLTFAVSKFHSGRVFIVYSPDVVPTFDNIGAYYNVLLDVQDQSVYTFKIPYQVPTPYAPIFESLQGDTGTFLTPAVSAGNVRCMAYGFVSIFVENQLRVMQTAAPTIDVLVELRGADNFHLVLPAGGKFRSLSTITTTEAPVVTAMGDERREPHTVNPPPRRIMPVWAAQLNESYDCRDVVKRYHDWFDIVSPAVVAGRGFTDMYMNVTVFHVPVPAFDAAPIQNVQFTDMLVGSSILNKSMVLARERINLATNNTISIRVPWTNYASMISNSINPASGRSNTMAPYSNGRVVVYIEYLSSYTTTLGAFRVVWDVTAGSASTRPDTYTPDMLTLLHDGFRFAKGDFNYQMDFTPVPSGANTAIRMRCFRAYGDGGNLYVFQGFPKMLGTYTPRQAISGVTPTRGGLQRQNIIGGGQRDLTQDGDIESNPGPTQSKPTGAQPPPDDILTDEDREGLEGGSIRISFFEKLGDYCKRALGWSGERIVEFIRELRSIKKHVGSIPGMTRISELITTIKELSVVTNGLNRMSAAVEELNEQIKKTREKVETFVGGVGGKLNSLDTGDLVSNGIEYVAYILNIYNSKSVGMTLINVAALLSKMGLGRYLVNDLVDRLGTFAKGEDTEEIEREYTSLIITGVLGAFGLGTMNVEKEGFVKPFLSNVKDFFRNGFAVKKFLDSHFKCINDICGWVRSKIFGKVDKGGLTVDLLVWCERVQVLAEVYNYDTILNDPEFAETLLSLQDEAFEFDRLFIASRIRPPNQYSMYRTKLQRAIDLLGQQGTMQKSKPVPFCLWVYGHSGCGKSHVCDNVLTEIGSALGINTANPIYTRSPDVEFWNGYTGQKLISWQDFAKITTGETYRKQVSELSSLIEPTPFNPPFAALEDKRKIADAWAVYVSSNKAFPEVQNMGMEDSALFYRRRHALVKMRINPEIIQEYARREPPISLEDKYKGQTVYYPSNIPSEDFATRGPYFHVQFAFHVTSLSTAEPTEWLGYDGFIAEVTRRAIDHRQREVDACIQRRGIYSKLRRSAPTGVEFREEVRTLKEELDRLTQERVAEAHGSDNAVKNLATTMDYEKRATFEETEALGSVILQYRLDPNCDCTNQAIMKAATSNEPRKICEVSFCEKCEPVNQRKKNVYKAMSEQLEGVAVSNPFGGIAMIERGDSARIPRAGRQYTPLDYARQATIGTLKWIQGKGLPAGYAYWSEIMPVCCHKKEILELAYFENVGDNIELVLDLSSMKARHGVSFPLFHKLEWFDLRKLDAWATTGFKVILPVVCEQSKFNWNNCIEVKPGERGRIPITPKWAPELIGRVTLEEFKRSWSCDAVQKPSVSYYKIEKDLIRFLVSGTYVQIEGVENMTAGLNHLMSLHTKDTVAFCNSFFYWKSGGKLRAAKFYPFVNGMLKDMSFIFSNIMIAVGAVMLAYKVYRLIRNSSECVEAQAKDYDQKTEAPKIPKVNFVQSTPVVVAAKGDEELSIIHNSLCQLRKGSMRLLGVRLCSNFVLAPQHLAWVPGEFGISLHSSGAWSTELIFEATSVKYSCVKGFDYAVYRFVTLPAGRNIVNYFTTRAQGATLKSEATLMTLSGASLQLRPVRISQYTGALTYDNASFPGTGTSMIGWQYWLGAQSVRCGSLIMSNNLLCGFHVAQNLKTGDAYAVSICKEMLVEALRILGATPFDMKMKRTTPITTVGEPKMQPPETAVVIPLGKAIEPVRYSGKSNLEKSIMHGELAEPFRIPAAQSATAKGECIGYDIVMKGCEKQFKPPKPIDPEEVEKIGDYLIERLVPQSIPLIPTISEPLSLGEAIAGIDGIPLMCGMKLNTSIGWPLCNEYPKGTKKSNIIRVDREEGEVHVDVVAFDDYAKANTLRKQAILPPTTFMDFPKDELLKPGKDTRLINGAPLHHTLDMRRYLMEFFAAITTINNKIAVGIDVHSGDWALIHGGADDVVDEDYSGFGPGFHSQWLTVVCPIAVAWCKHHKKVDKEYEDVVNCLIMELQNAYHVAGDLVYQVLCGSPSGAFATDRINSLANLCYHCLCHLRKYGTLTGFWSHYTLVYGDDTRRRETAYTGDEFQECMASVGIVVNRDKSGVTSFLKRQFIPIDHRDVRVMLAPLPRPIVEDILNWVRKPYASKLSALEETVGSYLSEIFHHGQDEFNNSRSKIQAILARHGSHPELPTFDDLFRQKYLSNGVWPVLMPLANALGPIPAAESEPTHKVTSGQVVCVPHEAGECCAITLGG
ncbi:polyprotein [Ectropis obliqua picorna-like virus]|uniref:Genome polyprotein n=2 Tax=Ectropis obliqua picorna-like virus TaxID=240555 RepID=POLG_EOPV|nr:polyprotein [Ectropis obliqua picorna-like virus]Q6UP17.1 RecName: Full=Non-structural polyprotein; Contains: RecName: Full=Helicase; Contains: RecName: Full=3C-like protease; Short=3CL-PRO; Contains: RecName: Full=RNA-directed RNA polymerase [Ectropis obliqua picorna-like virus]AAQ64627.1 polyprotein [Ectropis obliqua virus]